MFQVAERKKHEYWNHFIERWIVDGYGGGHGVTGPRLRKIKPKMWDNEHFWNDIIVRHNAHKLPPQVLRKEMPEIYGHCLGNFWGWVIDVMVTYGILK